MTISDSLVVANHTETNSMLKDFLKYIENEEYICYVNDWKAEKYKEFEYGKYIEQIDFDQRTKRIYNKFILANENRNKKRKVKDIEILKQSVSEMKKTEYVIVSAGPSLDDNISFLKNAVNDKVIIAVNTVVKRLEQEGIIPNIITMLDPLPKLEQHLEGIEYFTEGVPLVSVLSGSYKYIDAYRGDIYIVDQDDESKYSWMFSGTVSSLALDLAYYLGAEKIYLVGNDLAYPKDINYAEGVAHKPKEYMPSENSGSMLVESVDGGMVNTYTVYDFYRRIMEKQISEHPGVIVCNMSKHGANISGTQNRYIEGKE